MSSITSDTKTAVLTTGAATTENFRSGEYYRKALHMLPGLFAFVLPFTPHEDPLKTYSLVIVGSLCVVMTVVYLGLSKRVRRPEEDNFLSSALSYPVCVFMTIFLFPAQPEFTAAMVVILSLGDGAAYFGGKIFGQRTLPWNKHKTWMGFFSFILVSAPLATAVYYLEIHSPAVTHTASEILATPTFLTAAICCTVAAVLAAIAESINTKLTDNLRIGVASVAGLSGSYFLLTWLAS